MKRLLIVMCMISTSCMSMQTRRGIVEEQVQMHPELTALDAKIQVLDNRLDSLESIATKLDALIIKLDKVEEAHRDDTEMVMTYLRQQIDEIKKDLIPIKK